MQLNQGWFLANGRSGYVLQPEYMKQSSYNPFNKHTIVGVDPVTVTITVGFSAQLQTICSLINALCCIAHDVYFHSKLFCSLLTAL